MEIETGPNTGALVSWRTQGDNNEIEDRLSVPAENLVGIWTGTRIPFMGSVIMFMQSTLGLVVCIFVPIAALVAYEVIRRKKQDTAKQSDIDTLKAELEALKAARAQAEATQEPSAEETPAPTEEQPKDAE
jgi:signal peptidase